ncbi:MAG: hypothetical protein HKL98_08485 [Burkholderiales bacterium]|nr:hypothetical protein [Burkholderiales bacterium]
MELKDKDEQARYALWLHWSTLTGFITLIVTFLAYVTNLLPAKVPLGDLPHYWSMPADQYIKETGIPTGWGWLGMLGHGDLASLLGIAILSGCSIFCIAAVIPIYAKRKDKVYLLTCIFEIAILAVAASGAISGH